MELLRDPIWQFIGVLLPVTVLIVQILVRYIAKKPTLTYRDKLYQLPFRYLEYGMKIQSPTAMLLEEFPKVVHVGFVNRGSKPVNSNGSRFVQIHLGNKAKIITSKVVKTSPSNLPVTIDTNGGYVNVDLIRLRKNEGFVVEVTLLDYSGVRIEPASSDVVMQVFKKKRETFRVTIFGLGFAVGSSWIAVVALLTGEVTLSSILWYLFIMTFIAVLCFLWDFGTATMYLGLELEEAIRHVSNLE
jgi:hypothetical protein